jgi:signal transduction histidine kinase
VEIFRLHGKSKGIRVEVSEGPPSARVSVVEDQIVQVLLNLLLNAADASSESGTIRAGIANGNGMVSISVRDQGSGMSEEVCRQLFTPFFTTKEQGQGVGLGLFLSDSIARAHGGRIEVDSVPGTGSTFTLILPAGNGA